MKLSEIRIYPIKSMGGVSLPAARVLPKGLELDRRWMLINGGGRFMTQREYPQMALFKVSFRIDHIEVAYHNDTLQLPLAATPGTSVRTRIWQDEVLVMYTAPSVDQWFSERLGRDCKLVEFPEGNPRLVEPGHRTAEDQVRLQDAFPFLVIGQASLDTLNSRLPTPVPMDRFRPNFVFTGSDPHAEDTWGDFSIGNLPFQMTRPCVRCGIPGIDQETGLKGKEPLATLARYRRSGGNIRFGMNAVGPGYGQVTVGDEITVTLRDPR